MVSEDRRMRGWRTFCSEPLENIENYKEAIEDSERLWDCHHRREIDPDGTQHSAKELMSRGLYHNRPASELIFLPHSEHARLHAMGNKRFLNHKHTDAAKRRMSESSKWRTITESQRLQISATLKGKFINRPDLSKQVKMTRVADGMVKVFPSMAEAERWLRENGYPKASKSKICSACRGRSRAPYGATWAYAN